MISINFFVCKVGSIQIILDALKLQKPKKFRRGEFKFSQLCPAKKTTPLDQRGRSYVRHLIPDNINDTEFIYKVNFEPGKGQNVNFFLA